MLEWQVRALGGLSLGPPADVRLVVKLGTRTGMDPKYGSGMPFTAPGSVCPAALGAIRDWISAGATK